MKTEKIENLLSQARFIHPADSDLGLFEDGMLSEPARARLSAHLKLCPICQKRLAIMREALAAPATVSPSPKIAEFIRNLVSQPRPDTGHILVFSELAASLAAFEFQPQALAADTKASGERELWRCEGSDLKTKAHIVRLDDGRLVFRLSSNNSDYQDQPYILRIGRRAYRGKLERRVRGFFAEVPLLSLKQLGRRLKLALEFPPKAE